MAKRYGVRGYPSFIMVNAKGEVLARWIGYSSAEWWGEMATASLADQRTIVQKKSKYIEAPTLALAKALTNDALTLMEYPQAIKFLRETRVMDPSEASSYTREILQAMRRGLRRETITLEDVEGEANYVMNSTQTTIEEKVDVVVTIIRLANRGGNRQMAIPFIEEAVALSKGSTSESVIEGRALLEIEYALVAEKDADKATRLKKLTLDENWTNNPQDLNDYAWWCCWNNINLDEAEALVFKAVELAVDDDQRANILDTAAEICSARGNCDEAIERIKQAIALKPNKKYYKDQLARYEQEMVEKEEG